MQADRQNKRGLTLIEVMFTIAILSVVMTAATGIFAVIVKQRREAERLIDVQSVGVSSLMQLQSDLGNAGYRWPSPIFAVHVYNNPTQLLSGGNLGIVIDQGSGCGAGGLKVGSDAVEIVTGNPGYAPGDVGSVGPGMGANDVRIVLTQFGSGATATTPPFDQTANGVGVVLITDDTGESCIGRVTTGPAGGTAINVTILDRDFNDSTSKGMTSPNCPTASPATVKTRIYRMAQRIRYMVCQQTVAGVTTSGLYRQMSDVEPIGFGYSTAPVLVQPGVDDLQISARIYARAPPMNLGTGQDCFAATGAGEAWCFCNESPTSVCDLGADPTPLSLTKNSWAAWVNGLRVSVSALGSRPMQSGDPDAGALVVKDFVPPSGVNDGKRRIEMDVGVGLTNLAQVIP